MSLVQMLGVVFMSCAPLQIEMAKSKTANNRKIPLKSGLKIAHYIAEVKKNNKP